MRILVIEDNPADFELIRDLLSDAQEPFFEIETAQYLSSALSVLDGGRIDLILLDLGLPDSQGIDTVRSVRRHSPGIPIVVLTGLDDEETGLAALQKGAQDYFVKGQLTGSSLVRSMRYAQERKRIERELIRKNEELAAMQEELRQNLSDLGKSEQSLRETTQYLESLIAYANAPIIVWNAALKITRFNNAFERLTGLTAGEVIGHSPAILFPEALREELMGLIRKTTAGEQWEAVEISILTKEGRIRTVLWNSAAVYESDQVTVSSVIAQGQDITERKQAEEALRLQTDELIRLNQRLKSAYQEANLYLDILTHDIRNTENVSNLYTELLIDSMDGESAVHIEKLRRSIHKSIDILGTVAKIRRVHRGPPEVRPVDLDTVVREEVGHYPNRCIRYKGAPCRVQADDLLPEVFANLIGNAVKHGGPDVAIIVRTEEDDGFVQVTVEDTGPGVPDDHKTEIFHRYEQKKRGVGEGLGLYLVQILVERYGGKIWVEDRVPGRPEEGAAFRFTLRKAQDA